MANIDDSPEDLTLAEAVSYLAFDLLLTKDDLDARRVKHGKEMSKEDREKLHELATGEGEEERISLTVRKNPTGILAVKKNPDGTVDRNRLSQEALKKLCASMATVRTQGELLWPTSERYLIKRPPFCGGGIIDWMSNLDRVWWDFTPDDQVKIDGAQKNLLRLMIDKDVTGTGFPKVEGQAAGEERQTIPPKYLSRRGVGFELLSGVICEDGSQDGNFGRDLTSYQHVWINRAELKAAAGGGVYLVGRTKSPARRGINRPETSPSTAPAPPRPPSERATRKWYESRHKNWPEGEKQPNREGDRAAYKKRFKQETSPRVWLRTFRNEIAPEWTKAGAKKKPGA